MDWRQVLREGAAGLSGHKLRAGLAMLGIAIGVGAVIAMVALGAGMRGQFTAEFDKLGANLVLVSPEPPDADLLAEGDGRVRALSLEDGAAVAAQGVHVAGWSADLPAYSATLTRAGLSADAEIHGVTPSYADLRNFRAASGRLIEQDDLDEGATVCVLGSEVADEVFGPGEDPVGREVVIGFSSAAAEGAAGGLRCRVVGVLVSKGEAMWMRFDRYVLVPITTVQRRLQGRPTVGQLMFQVAEGSDPDRAAFEIHTLMLRRHRGTRDFRVRLQTEFREIMENSLRTFQLFIGGIAGISLLVGGIGITNIMLISVLERTREIGVRMAIGARRGHILGQFLTESLAIGGLGGLGGLLLGPLSGSGMAWALTTAFEMETPWRSTTSPLAAGIAFAFSLLVGVAAGIYPAIKASRLDPVEALRYE